MKKGGSDTPRAHTPTLTENTLTEKRVGGRKGVRWLTLAKEREKTKMAAGKSQAPKHHPKRKEGNIKLARGKRGGPLSMSFPRSQPVHVKLGGRCIKLGKALN